MAGGDSFRAPSPPPAPLESSSHMEEEEEEEEEEGDDTLRLIFGSFSSGQG